VPSNAEGGQRKNTCRRSVCLSLRGPSGASIQVIWDSPQFRIEMRWGFYTLSGKWTHFRLKKSHGETGSDKEVALSASKVVERRCPLGGGEF